MPQPIPYKVLFADQSQTWTPPLPTPNDIHDSELLKETLSSRIVKLQNQFVIKYGKSVNPMEAENTRYVAEHTTVPVPKIYAVYQDLQTDDEEDEEDRCTTYILMEYIAGTSLIDLWGDLTTDRKRSISETLRQHFGQLRQTKAPGYFGNVAGGPPLDDIFTAPLGVAEISGALKTEDEFIDCIGRVYRLEAGEGMHHKADYYQRILPAVLRGNGVPVFTHGDFQRKNVIVQDDGRIVLIDWEFAGWYPSYWEHSTAMFAMRNWRDDWYQYLHQILEEYPNQSVWLSMLRVEMWC